MKHFLHRLTCCWGLTTVMCAAYGQSADIPVSLRDPMRPPQSVMGSFADPQRVAGQSERGSGGDVADSRIQVLKIGKSRQFAIIDGQLMQPGDVKDQWRLVRIHDQGVVLQNATETQTLASNPSVEKTLRSASVSPQTSSQNSTRRSP